MEAIGGFAVFIMVLAVFAVIFIAKSVRVVPQQEAWVVERFGKFHTVLQPGLNFIIPIIGIALPIARRSKKFRWTHRAKSALPKTTLSCRWTASSTFRSPIRNLPATERPTL